MSNQAQFGKLTGVGEVRGPNGELKATFTLHGEAVLEDAQRAADALNVKLEEGQPDGNHASR